MNKKEVRDSQKHVKPLKRHPALVPLSHDHHHGLSLCFKIRTGLKKDVETERVRNYVIDFFDRHLKKHFSEEEEVLLKWLDKNNEKRIETENQHKSIYKLKEELEDNNKNHRNLLEIFEKELNAHIRFEERDLFPYLQEKFSSEQLSDIAKQLEESHTEFCETWEDRFWEK